MPSNLLLLPLLGGYCFVHLCHYFRFRAQRSDGYRLLLEAAIAGVILSGLARLGVLALRFLPCISVVRPFWNTFSPFPFSGTAVGSLLLGITLAPITNWIWNEEWAKNKLLRCHGNALFKLLHEAASGRKPIAVTMNNRKWYMGYVQDSPNLDPQERFFSLIPILSGYRDKDSLEVKVTVSYAEAYNGGLDINSFAVTIPLDSVTGANYFDKDIWEKYFFHPQRRARKRKADPKPPASQ